MQKLLAKRAVTRSRRVMRVRKKLKGTAEQPRMSVYKSNKQLYVQLINDEEGKTIAGLGTFSKKSGAAGKSKELAKKLGEQLGKIAVEKKIERVIFDRGRYKYHGVIAEIANGARSAGLKF